VCFSGIQSTGIPHLGNYIGAIQNWVKLQDAGFDQAYFSVVDFHSITVPQNPAELRQNTRDTAIALLASGIDPEKSVLFQQARVAQHTELAWILGCITSTGQLSTMTQWKTKKNNTKAPCLGLFSYPVLMAADILLYRGTHVPVGNDQQQHMELARTIATNFNTTFGDTFPRPEPMFTAAPRMMSLRDPLKKMSKSDFSPNSRIDLTDTPDVVQRRIRKAITDSLPSITYDPVERPGVSNLLQLYASLGPAHISTPQEAAHHLHDLDMAQFKAAVTDAVVEHLTPIQQEMKRLHAAEEYVEAVLDAGAAKAQAHADQTMTEVRQLVGLR
jgi:tryptophanyl-tRNA synthetase